MIVDDLERQQVDVTEVVSDDDIILKSRGFAALCDTNWLGSCRSSCNSESYAEYHVVLYFRFTKALSLKNWGVKLMGGLRE